MIGKCVVLRCEKEVYEEGKMCKDCQEFSEDKGKYVLLVCWGCGQIVDIYHKEIEGSIIFAKGCRECGEKKQEKETFLVDKEESP